MLSSLSFSNLKNLFVISLYILILVLFFLQNNELKDLQIDYAKLDSELKEERSFSKIKDINIENLKKAINEQNAAIELIKVDKKEKEIIFKDRVEFITQTIEKEREVIKYLKPEDDCNKTKELINDFFN